MFSLRGYALRGHLRPPRGRSGPGGRWGAAVDPRGRGLGGQMRPARLHGFDADGRRHSVVAAIAGSGTDRCRLRRPDLPGRVARGYPCAGRKRRRGERRAWDTVRGELCLSSHAVRRGCGGPPASGAAVRPDMPHQGTARLCSTRAGEAVGAAHFAGRCSVPHRGGLSIGAARQRDRPVHMAPCGADRRPAVRLSHPGSRLLCRRTGRGDRPRRARHLARVRRRRRLRLRRHLGLPGARESGAVPLARDAVRRNRHGDAVHPRHRDRIPARQPAPLSACRVRHGTGERGLHGSVPRALRRAAAEYRAPGRRHGAAVRSRIRTGDDRRPAASGLPVVARHDGSASRWIATGMSRRAAASFGGPAPCSIAVEQCVGCASSFSSCSISRRTHPVRRRSPTNAAACPRRPTARRPVRAGRPTCRRLCSSTSGCAAGCVWARVRLVTPPWCGASASSAARGWERTDSLASHGSMPRPIPRAIRSWCMRISSRSSSLRGAATTTDRARRSKTSYAAEAPAATRGYLHFVEPRFRIGIQSMLGFDTVVASVPQGVALGKTPLGDASVLTGAPDVAQAQGLAVGKTSRVGTTARLG